jgi:hypothetical protein
MSYQLFVKDPAGFTVEYEFGNYKEVNNAYDQFRDCRCDCLLVASAPSMKGAISNLLLGDKCKERGCH